MMGPKKHRHEIKYLLSHAEYLEIKGRISAILAPDINQAADGYFIRSIYFDDLSDKAYWEKVNGVYDRRKYRIRAYNNDPSYIVFESKEKYDKLIAKQSVRINEHICESLVSCDYAVLEDAADGILKEFYFAAMQSGMRPVVTVDYMREAFVYPVSNLRVSFDRHLRVSGLRGFDIAGKSAEDDLSLPIYRHDNVVMEIKYDDFYPRIIRDIMPQGTGRAQSISKYCLCRGVVMGLRT